MNYLIFTAWLCSAAVSQQWATEFTALETLENLPTSSDKFSKQVAKLISNTSISEERLRDVPFMLQDLELALNTRWPGSRVFVFGSLVYGFATTNSDVDCIIVLPHRTDTSHAFIEDAANTLRQYPTLFTNLFPITSDRIPVLSLEHIPTQFKVDLTVNNFAGVQTSNLLRYLLHLDERIYKLMFVTKRWAHVRKLSLTNYGLTLMVIFYSQQRGMMPSLASLQINANPFFENEWNMGFSEIVGYDIQNDLPLNLLLNDFFKYYVNFDYDKYIVSPYTGYPVEKQLFVDVNQVPNEFSLYKENVRDNVSEPLSLENAFVLQDMFIHNGNIAKQVDISSNSTFLAEFKYAAKKFRKNNIKFLKKILKHKK